MTVLTPIHRIKLQAGSSITIPDLNWQQFEEILAELPQIGKWGISGKFYEFKFS